MARNILILGASYGSLLGTKLLMAGHNVPLVCRRKTAELITREGTEARIKLRDMVTPVSSHIWAENETAGPKRFEATSETEDYVNAIYALQPQTEAQRRLRERVVQATLELANALLELFSQLNTLLPPPLLVMLAFWFAVLFAAYSMYAEINAVSVVALVVCAASVAGAMFLLFQMNNPFSGLMGIPRIDFVALMPSL